MARRSSEAWWFQHWGRPCDLHDPIVVLINGHKFRTDGRMKTAWDAWERVRARHGYDVHKPYNPLDEHPGDSGMFNCRHIGSDSSRPMSVHAWAGALDVNWRTNPDGSRLITDMPPEMRRELMQLRTRSGAPVFRWGGDWDRDPRTDHSYYDAMHWEIVATPAELASGVIDPNAHTIPPEEIMDTRAFVVMSYLGALGRPPETIKVIEDSIHQIEQHPGGVFEGQNQFMADLANSEEAVNYRKNIQKAIKAVL